MTNKTQIKNLLTVILLIVSTLLLAQKREQKGWVTELNSGKKPLGGVLIDFIDAVPTTSDSYGFFILSFRDKSLGEIIHKNKISKKGYELVNDKELELAKLNDKSLTIVMCKEGFLDSMRAEYYNISIEAITREYKEKLESYKKQFRENKLTTEKFLNKIDKLEALREISTKNADELSNRFASINFDDVSEVYLFAFSEFKKGNIDSAIVILEKEDLIARAKKRLMEREQINEQLIKLDEWETDNNNAKMEDITAAKLAAKSYCSDEQYDRANTLYQYMYLIDPTNIENILIYANFLSIHKQYDKSIYYYQKILVLPNCSDSLTKAILPVLENLYNKNTSDGKN